MTDRQHNVKILKESSLTLKQRKKRVDADGNPGPALAFPHDKD